MVNQWARTTKCVANPYNMLHNKAINGTIETKSSLLARFEILISSSNSTMRQALHFRCLEIPLIVHIPPNL